MIDVHELTDISDLRPASYNPRTIEDDAAAGLAQSLERFGDLSGIVWNQRTGHLVAGHQRVNQLRERGAQLVGGVVVSAHGSFPRKDRHRTR